VTANVLERAPVEIGALSRHPAAELVPAVGDMNRWNRMRVGYPTVRAAGEQDRARPGDASAGIAVAWLAVMALTWRRLALGALAALYLTATGWLAGLAVERIWADRERTAVIRAREQRQREARDRAIRVELEHEARRPARPPR
jgi:hypothetical protein